MRRSVWYDDLRFYRNGKASDAAIGQAKLGDLASSGPVKLSLRRRLPCRAGSRTTMCVE